MDWIISDPFRSRDQWFGLELVLQTHCYFGSLLLSSQTQLSILTGKNAQWNHMFCLNIFLSLPPFCSFLDCFVVSLKHVDLNLQCCTYARLHCIMFEILAEHSHQRCLSGFPKTLIFSCLFPALKNISHFHRLSLNGVSIKPMLFMTHKSFTV